MKRIKNKDSNYNRYSKPLPRKTQASLKKTTLYDRIIMIFGLALLGTSCSSINSDCSSMDVSCNPVLAHLMYNTSGPRFVTVSGSGSYYSDDGRTWTASTDATAFRKVASGKNIFVALPTANPITNIHYSTDGGDHWTASTAFASSNIDSVAFDGVNFVAIGDSGTASFCHYSADAISWATCTTAPAFIGSNTYVAIAYNPHSKKLLTARSFGAASFTLASGGNDWVPAANPTNTLFDLTYGTSQSGFAFVGTNSSTTIEYTSDDGATWTPIGGFTPEANLALVFGLNKLVMVGGSGTANAWYSNDHTVSTTAGTGTTTTDILSSVAFGNNTFVAVGDNNIGPPTINVTYFSTDGINWTAGTGIPTSVISFDDVEFGSY